ncbi:hypothetical protein KZ829_24675 [Actinoplanes hulinensis]|uniref:Uncharacterized protein n=1 Tax=Actinoplanes hulinensis TaxID=1144547 RepID=A0ABS7B7Q0_9ACTN|nr:hypothetical protein [Actinoplanes hulinensis]MBW6436942.1 hypothetical protein [Actinoplanes hulinensis]
MAAALVMVLGAVGASAAPSYENGDGLVDSCEALVAAGVGDVQCGHFAGIKATTCAELAEQLRQGFVDGYTMIDCADDSDSRRAGRRD